MLRILRSGTSALALVLLCWFSGAGALDWCSGTSALALVLWTGPLAPGASALALVLWQWFSGLVL